MKLDVQLIKDLYDTLAFDEAPSGDDKTDAEVYRKHHNKLIQSLSLLEHLEKRLAILEAAVAWHGFDELPEKGEQGWVEFIEVKHADGSSSFHYHCWRRGYYTEEGFTAWRYPVGDLSE